MWDFSFSDLRSHYFDCCRHLNYHLIPLIVVSIRRSFIHGYFKCLKYFLFLDDSPPVCVKIFIRYRSFSMIIPLINYKLNSSYYSLTSCFWEFHMWRTLFNLFLPFLQWTTELSEKEWWKRHRGFKRFSIDLHWELTVDTWCLLSYKHKDHAYICLPFIRFQREIYWHYLAFLPMENIYQLNSRRRNSSIDTFLLLLLYQIVPHIIAIVTKVKISFFKRARCDVLCWGRKRTKLK